LRCESRVDSMTCPSASSSTTSTFIFEGIAISS
jgi:hypothetical protein